MHPLVYLLVGLAIGGLIGWWLKARGQAEGAARIEGELRSQLATREAELAALRAGQTQSASALATAQAQLLAERQAHAGVRIERDRIAQQSAEQQEAVQGLRRQLVEREERLKFTEERLAAERQQIELLQQKFARDFEAVSNKLLVESSTKFNQQSAESLDRLLLPLRENLTLFKSSLDATRNEAASHNALLKEQIGRIGSEAANLAKALKGDAKVLGNWGENLLEQLLEKSGLKREVHYRRQQSATDAEGSQRYLDVVVNLPEQRHLVIDSKVSLRAFEEACNSPDDALRRDLLGRHVEATRKHFRELGGKRYSASAGINAPDFVLMYIPIEAAYFSAITAEPTIFEEAFESGVVLVTNSTLLPTLRTVANVWRLADQQKNAVEIAERGGRLYDKFVGFIEDLTQVGGALDHAREAWDGAMGKLHRGPGNLVRQTEQLKALGVKAAKALPLALVEQSYDGERSRVATAEGVN